MKKWKLEELINLKALQTMSDNLYKVIGIPIGLLDTDGNILVAAGWQDICVKYHRANPQTSKRCSKSDKCIKMHLANDDFVAYKCLNNMWDVAVPIIVNGEHISTVFIGQFFYEEEIVDVNLFREQSVEFGFDENDYITALHKVPVFSKAKIRNILEYYKSFVLTLVESSIAKLLYKDTHSKLSKLFNSMQDYIFILDSSGYFIEFNKSMAEELNPFLENFIGKSYCEVLPVEQCELFSQAIQKLENQEAIQPFDFLLSVNNYEKWFSAQISKVQNYMSGETNCYMVVLRDITERKMAEDEILYLSYHDKLTGVYNRRYYEDQIRKLDNNLNLPISIIIGDVNGLKIVNDVFGHDKGDEFLKRAAYLIQSACKPDGLVARWGGDEFVILLPKTQKEEVEKIVKRMKELFFEEYVNSINISISFGWDTKTVKDEDIMSVVKGAEDYMYQHKIIENKGMRGNIISTIINTLHEKNSREEQHSKRVSEICQNIGQAMGFSETEVNKLKVVGLLHDIGKIAIGDGILDKPGKLTESELNEIKRHPDIGYRILCSSYDMLDLAECTWAHHERWDGEGYPKGLKGKDIPILSRIITLADSYDAMTSERPYRRALREDEVSLEIQKNAGSQFDPEIARVFIEKVLGKPWDL